VQASQSSRELTSAQEVSAIAALGVNWYHNYNPTTDNSNPTSNMHVPAFFDTSYLTAPNIAAAIASPSSAILTFNEPDNLPPGGSNISVATALANWHQFETMGKRIGAPPTAQSNANGTWIVNFMGGTVPETGLPPQVDFMTVHKYLAPGASLASKLSTLGTYLAAIYAAWKRPLWLTEVSIITFTTSDPATWVFGTQQEYIDLFSALPWWLAQNHPYVERFCPYPLAETPAVMAMNAGFANIVLADNSTGALTAVGTAYRDAHVQH